MSNQTLGRRSAKGVIRAAVALELAGGVVVRAGIALTGVGSETIDAADAAAVLVGRPLTAESAAEAAELAAQAARPRSDHRGSADYKRQVVRTFVERILSQTVEPEESAA
jgi:carbon-monoxide dehydrogenase medium subunit